MRGAKLSRTVAAFALLLPFVVASATTTAAQSQPGGGNAQAAAPPLQPIITEPAPAAKHRLPFGEVTVAPTTVVTGAPDQAIRVKLELTRPPGADELLVNLRRVGHGTSPQLGRSTKSAIVETKTMSLRNLRAGSTRSLELARLNPPPGPHQLEFFAREGKGETRLLQRAAVVVYAQHRLPPGRNTGASALSGAALPNKARALAADGAENNISFQFGDQAETFVAVRPNQSSRVIAAVNHTGGSSDPPPAWISNNFMRPGSEVKRTLPDTSLRKAAEGGGTISTDLCCDPALAADRLGNLWYAVLADDDGGPAPEYIVINRVAAGTTTFRPNNVAIPRATTGPQDKEMVTIDNTPSSPKYGMLYVVWTENPGQNIVISQCNTRPGGVAHAARCDNPTNWSEPARITDAGGGYIYASVAAAPNGTVYVVWQDYSADNDIEIDRCAAASNCALAASWGPDKDVDNLDALNGTALPFFCPIIPAPGGRVGPQPYVDVGPDGRVYVAYSDLRANGPTKCKAQPSDRTFDSYIARGATPNTFPAVNSGVRLSDDSASAKNDHFFPSLTVDHSTGEVHSSLYSTKADPAGQKTHQYAVRSTDGGVSYGAMRRITTEQSDYSVSNGFDYGDYEGADSAQGRLYPVWTDNRFSHGGDAELYTFTRKVPGPALVHQATAVNDSGGDADGAVEPGEPFTLTETVRNSGTAAATGVSGVLSISTPGLSITQPSSPYPDIPTSSTGANTNPFEATLSGSAACGTSLDMSLALTTDQGSFQVPVTVLSGKLGAPVMRNSTDVPKAIPDLTPPFNPGVTNSNLTISTPGIIRDVNVRIASLSHTFVGDLRLQLIGPDSTIVRLANRPGGPDNSGDNFTNTVFDDEAAIGLGGRGSAAPYTGSFRPQADRLSRFDGKQQQGTWTLRVTDLSAGDTGTLNGWGTVIRRAVCD